MCHASSRSFEDNWELTFSMASVRIVSTFCFLHIPDKRVEVFEKGVCVSATALIRGMLAITYAATMYHTTILPYYHASVNMFLARMENWEIRYLGAPRIIE